MQFDRDKLKSVILYACTAPERLGAVKLHKVLYYADMLRFVHVGTPLTGSTYRKRPLGPTCDQLLGALRELKNAGQLQIEDVEYFGYLKKQYKPIARPDIKRLNSDEISLLNDVLDFVCNNNTAKTISEYSHNKAWEMADYGDVLPYVSAFRMFPTQVSEESLDWALEQEALVEQRKASQSDLGLVPFSTLRARVLERMGEK